MQVVDQREAAKLPFHSRYPSSKLVAWLLDRAGLLKPFKPLRVLDLTYGQGIFWDAIAHRVVVAGFDVKRLEWVTTPRCFFEAPAQDWKRYSSRIRECLHRVDLVVVDPPWQKCVKGNGCRGRGIGGRYHYRVSHATGSPQSILIAAADAAAYYNTPLLVHYKERWIPQDFNLLVETWWKPFLPNVDKYDYKNWWGILARG